MKNILLLLACTLLSTPGFAQGGHCEDRCNAPGFDISGFVTGPSGAANARVYVYDYSQPNVQDFANCLTANLNGRTFSNQTCPQSVTPIVWAPTNAGVNGTYSMKDANGKGVDAGKYLILVIDSGWGGAPDHSGVAVGSWQSEVVDVSGDLQHSVQLTPN